jgi:ribonuclease D
MHELYIDTPEQLDDLCDRIRRSPWLALDTEFVREKHYYPTFCLLQLFNGEIAACIDPLAIEDLSPLREILFDPGIVKIFHAGRQDLEIFHQLWGELPRPLFDTQLAATLLGLGDQIGYGNLVQKLLNHELDKGHSRTDWSRRPLQETQLRYALDDVIYLADIYLQLKGQLEELGREGWLEDDFAALSDPATYTVVPGEMWRRIKGRKYLKGVQLAVLQSLTAWRETEAQRSDRPKRWIVKDEVLVDLARHNPTDSRQLERIRGLEPGTIKRHGETLLGLIAEARALPKSEWPTEKKAPARLSTNQEAQVDLLMACLRLLADRNNITHNALAGRKELERLVAGDTDIDLLSGWRRSLAGATLRDVLDGRTRPVMEQGQLTLRPES